MLYTVSFIPIFPHTPQIGAHSSARFQFQVPALLYLRAALVSRTSLLTPQANSVRKYVPTPAALNQLL